MTPAPPCFPSPSAIARAGVSGRHGSHARRAGTNHALLLPLVLGLFLSGGLAGCHDANGAGATATRSAEARIQEYIEALKPLDKTVTSDISDRKFIEGMTLTAELSAAGPEVGHAALRALQTQEKKVVPVERGLLMVGARAATTEALPLLENLVTQYGPSLDLRTEAALLLAEVAPARALPILEPLVLRKVRNQTTPPVEFLVKAWCMACDKTGRSPVPELCDVATDLMQEGSARVAAVHELGKRPDPRGNKALQAILVESTGDGYLRRMAAQGLRDTLPAETACVIFRAVADKEQDMNFLLFLGDMLEKNCGS